jgi:hypothetical protein
MRQAGVKNVALKQNSAPIMTAESATVRTKTVSLF